MIDWVFYIGLAFLILGALAILGIAKIFKVSKAWNIVFVIVGILLVTGLGATLWGGLTTLAVEKAPTNNAPSVSAYSYQVTPVANVASELVDNALRTVTLPVNSTGSDKVISANFTIGITDAYADMRGVPVSCDTQAFYQQNVSVSDSTLYTIVTKDSAGKADIRIMSSDGSYLTRSRTFLLGGQSSTGQTVTVRIQASIDPTSAGKLNVLGNAPITCDIAGQNWVLNVQRTS